jgi:hypothetical protein
MGFATGAMPALHRDKAKACSFGAARRRLLSVGCGRVGGETGGGIGGFNKNKKIKNSKRLKDYAARWNPRGFGFIRLTDGDDVFCHFCSIKLSRAMCSVRVTWWSTRLITMIARASTGPSR